MNSLRDPGLVVALGLAVLVCDVIARHVQDRLDLEELRLSQQEPAS